MIKNYLSEKKINNINIRTAFFTRKNGFSDKKFGTLNCSFGTGDSVTNVKKNIEKSLKNINLIKTNLKTVNQIHSNKVIFIEKANYKKKYQADGMITTNKNISLAILTADCCPIFIYDIDSTFICCLHSGWKGCYLNIVSEALKKINKFKLNKNKINAVIGPCLSRNNFEVEDKFKIKFIKKNINNRRFFFNSKVKNKKLFDMRAMIKNQFLEKGIRNIHNINFDTYSNKDLFFSHRRSTHLNELPTGRMINIIGFGN